MATGAEIIRQSAKCLSIKLDRIRLWVLLIHILSNRLVDKVPVFCRQMGIGASTADGSGFGLPCLSQVLLKAILSGLARLRLLRDVVLHLRPSWHVRRVKILEVHAQLTPGSLEQVCLVRQAFENLTWLWFRGEELFGVAHLGNDRPGSS
ncbi:hypothetical protein XI01_14420 [Bradyrhizobium sp. CCBAU 21360]|nr:hypothetical protein [Bradyrhizobium sp. CCBAU 21360]